MRPPPLSAKEEEYTLVYSVYILPFDLNNVLVNVGVNIN